MAALFTLTNIVGLLETLPLTEVLVGLYRCELGATNLAAFLNTHCGGISR